MKKLFSDLDCQQNKLVNAVLEHRSSDPTSPIEGQMYYNTNDQVFKGWDGSSWISLIYVPLVEFDYPHKAYTFSESQDATFVDDELSNQTFTDAYGFTNHEVNYDFTNPEDVVVVKTYDFAGFTWTITTHTLFTVEGLYKQSTTTHTKVAI